MSWLHGGVSRLRGFLLRSREETEMNEELAFHLEMEVGRNVAAGMSSEEARRRAVIAFGGVERYREATRDERRVPFIDDLWLDARSAIRTLARTPAYSAVIVLTLALAMGTSIAIETLVRGLILDPIPIPASERLVSIDRTTQRGVGYNPRYEDFRAWEAELDGRARLGAYTFGTQTIGDDSGTSYGRGVRVTEGFFSALSLAPRLGRTLVPADFDRASQPVVLLSHRIWERELGSDPAVVGRTVRLDGRAHTVVGVLAPGLEFPTATDLWTPLLPDADEAAELYVSVIGRLGAGTTREEIQAGVTAIQSGLEADLPPEERTLAVTTGFWTGRWAEDAIQGMRLLQLSVLLLLLIGAANASGLMLTKGITRARELAIRASLGATRWRLGRQLLAESVLLAMVAGALGLFVAWLTIRLVRLGASETFVRQNMLGWDRLGLDARSVAYELALGAIVGIVFGITPAVKAVGREIVAGLREGAPTATTDRKRSRFLRFLLGGEVALALVLLTVAGLLTRSVLELVRLDPGYASEGLLTTRWTLPADRPLDADPISSFQTTLLEQLAGTVGIEAVAITSNLPTTRFGRWSREYRLGGSDPTADPLQTGYRSVTPGYLAALGIPLVAGRDVEPADRDGSPPVAIVSESLARRHWANPGEAIGSTLVVADREWTVVGVAGDVLSAARVPAPAVYVPQAQAPTAGGIVVARVRGDMGAIAPRIRDAVWSIDSSIAVDNVETMEGMIQDSYANDRTLAMLVVVFAVLALVITIISLYTLVAHSVARRRREFGIRLALGALPRQVLRGAMWDGLVAVTVGSVLGAALGRGVTRLMGGMVYGFNPNDPLVLVLATAGLLVVATLASYLPARSAASTDPLVSLRVQ